MRDLMFHFLPADGRLAYDDGREVVVGETLTVDCEPALCQRGLHASRDIVDAMWFCRGPVLTVVVLGGRVIHGDDKSVGTSRTCLWKCDVSATLRHFACDCAERALSLVKNPDPRSIEAIRVARLYADGKATAGDLAIARAAAWDAARAAAWDAWDAAVAAAVVAARAAARAAWDADAVYAAVRQSEREWQRERLLTLLRERDGLNLDELRNDSEETNA